MILSKRNAYGVGGIENGESLHKTRNRGKFRKRILIFLVFFTLIHGLYAQTSAPNTDTKEEMSLFSLDGGVGMGDILVDGSSVSLILDPKLRITPEIMIGSKNGLTFSTDGIISLETQAYFRWNFLRLNPFKNSGFSNTTDIFIQGGLGFLGVVKGPRYAEGPNRKKTRASLLFDGTFGVTVPLTSRWHIEPSIRGGYPFLWGVALTAGYRFPLPKRIVNQQTPVRTEYIEKTEYVDRIQYVEVIKSLPPNEIIKRIIISQVEYILFGPNIGRYNTGIDNDARALNDLVLNSVSAELKANPDLRIRIEGHANPVTSNPNEARELMALGATRANEIARLLKERGVAEEQIVVISYGGARTVASDRDHLNMNRRAELILIQVDTN